MALKKQFGPLGIIPLPGCEKLACQVNRYLTEWRRREPKAGCERDSFLVDVKVPRFKSGEAKGILPQTVRGLDLFIMVDVCNYSVTYDLCGQQNPMSPDDHYQNLKRVIAACTGKPARINVIMPFLYESRQHRRTVRESLDCANMLQELAAMGVTNILTFDAHDPRISNAIPLTGFDNFPTSYQFVKTLINLNLHERFDKNEVLIISPDEGAVERAIYFATILGVNVSMFYKRRDYTQVINGRNPIVAHEYLGEPVEGKTAIIVDDMIGSGDSMVDVARQLKARGARSVIACASFGLFTSGLEVMDEACREGLIDRVLTTNLIYQNPQLLERDWYASVDMSEYLASVIDTMNHNSSLERLMTPSQKITTKLEETVKN
ncbi:MAG: ribose-phosphate pyrophosphokinase [Lachnospiraceae bacterium]|nr:ribose-phosphate pyrophosphokinase [Lachnospiraceae bacterium]